jgi:hypothetical protein
VGGIGTFREGWGEEIAGPSSGDIAFKTLSKVAHPLSEIINKKQDKRMIFFNERWIMMRPPAQVVY